MHLIYNIYKIFPFALYYIKCLLVIPDSGSKKTHHFCVLKPLLSNYFNYRIAQLSHAQVSPHIFFLYARHIIYNAQ